MKELKFLCVQPDDTYYTWQVHLWIESLREIGQSKNAIILLFMPEGRPRNSKWDQIIALYPEAEWLFIKDEHKISKLLSLYIPILRPYCLMRYFTDHPEMKEKAIFYCDSDVLFTETFDIQQFVDDDINYLSDTNSYINASYFDSKIKDVLPDKLEAYKQIDVLDTIASKVGVSREIAEKNNNHSGGAQYLLKNIDAAFWNDVITSCIVIRTDLTSVNREYFKDENAGFQSWCADMWAVLWNLWKREYETRVIPEMGFSWAPDFITKLKTHPILHNAGVTGPFMGTIAYFYKGTYHTGKNPLEDPHLQVVLENEESGKRCTSYYLKKLLQLKEKYNLTY